MTFSLDMEDGKILSEKKMLLVSRSLNMVCRTLMGCLVLKGEKCCIATYVFGIVASLYGSLFVKTVALFAHN